MHELVTKNVWLLFSVVLLSLFVSRSRAADSGERPLKVLILDGHNPHHNWQVTTPLLQHLLRDSGRFQVDIATAPPEGEDMSHYRPEFSNYDVVLSNYNSQHWDDEIKESFLDFVRNGGGFVCVHAANNAFADWQEYNEICGLGGWGGRDERWGPYVYFQNDELIRDESPGRAGHHGPQHEFQITMRDLDHPIIQGLPAVWMHSQDELYDRLRGPAENMHILASAFSDPAQNGTGRHEPMMMVLNYGEGRVFHTVLGHADYSMRCVGFITTLLRGTEWAATGEVTIPVPDDFPTANMTSARD